VRKKEEKNIPYRILGISLSHIYNKFQENIFFKKIKAVRKKEEKKIKNFQKR
jgi:hypothetical protein